MAYTYMQSSEFFGCENFASTYKYTKTANEYLNTA